MSNEGNGVYVWISLSLTHLSQVTSVISNFFMEVVSQLSLSSQVTYKSWKSALGGILIKVKTNVPLSTLFYTASTVTLHAVKYKSYGHTGPLLEDDHMIMFL